ncbi:uracil-DNA glycosylase family protein [Armatimonas rosea]|uniref:Uracil-DNA glycosylase n=1 Tax=Armatimonas rosea TaxID=685828 RepID=A0A7W9WAA9_ARMRO|nr:uracil-DNA glycosylase [Armatimonas rosea]
MDLEVLQQEIRSCTRCVDSGFIPHANPLVLGQPGATIFLIGQAPSRTDHESGRFYEGPAGRKLRGWFLDAGFEEADFGTRIYAAAITKCFPGRNPGSSKDRVPSPTEQKLCRHWLDAELAAVQPKALVLFGGLAIKTFLSKAPLEELIGQVFEKDGRLYLPLPHSSGASTWLNSAHNQALLAQALVQLEKLRECV